MSIRIANINDAANIKSLLNQLGYPTQSEQLTDKIVKLINHPDQSLVVYDDAGVKAVMSIHFVPQIALDGDFAIISYLAVDESARSEGIGRKLEDYCVRLAEDRNCDRIQVHCNIRRTEAHRFYERQGYQESRKYFIKSLKNKKINS
nr:GNAT family N-acetyltransferase [Mucilaginibacter sp. L294]